MAPKAEHGPQRAAGGHRPAGAGQTGAGQGRLIWTSPPLGTAALGMPPSLCCMETSTFAPLPTGRGALRRAQLRGRGCGGGRGRPWLRAHDRMARAITQCQERGMGRDEAELEAFYAVAGGPDYGLFESCQPAQTEALFPPYFANFPWHTQSIPASNWLRPVKKSLPTGHTSNFQTAPNGIAHRILGVSPPRG